MCKATSGAIRRLIWAAILAVAALSSSATGFQLAHEEFRTATSKTGATLHYRVNPDVEDAIKVEAVHRSHLNHPRASHPAQAEMQFRDKIGGTIQGYYGKPRSVHGEVWSLLSNGRVEHARDLHKAVMEEDHHEVHRQRMGVRRSNNRDTRRQHEEARIRFKETAEQGGCISNKVNLARDKPVSCSDCKVFGSNCGITNGEGSDTDTPGNSRCNAYCKPDGDADAKQPGLKKPKKNPFAGLSTAPEQGECIRNDDTPKFVSCSDCKVLGSECGITSGEGSDTDTPVVKKKKESGCCTAPASPW